MCPSVVERLVSVSSAIVGLAVLRLDSVDFAALEQADRFTDCRLLEPTRCAP